MENGPSGCQAPGASLVGVVAPFAALTALLLFAVLLHNRGAVGAGAPGADFSNTR
jgi:hypothetical protein